MAQSNQSPKFIDLQNQITIWVRAKALVVISTWLFIMINTITGAVVFAENVTPLGTYLIGRAALQTVFSRLNLKKMREITRNQIIGAIKRRIPEHH